MGPRSRTPDVRLSRPSARRAPGSTRCPRRPTGEPAARSAPRSPRSRGRPGRGGPRHLGERGQAGEGHEVHVDVDVDELVGARRQVREAVRVGAVRPQGRLDPGDTSGDVDLPLRVEGRRQLRLRVPRVRALEVDPRGPLEPVRGEVVVPHVEVRPVRGRHDEVGARGERRADLLDVRGLARGPDEPLVALAHAPVLDQAALRQGRALSPLVPAHDRAPVLLRDDLVRRRGVVLVPPLGRAGGLVPAQVDVRARVLRDHGREHGVEVLPDRRHVLVARADHGVVHLRSPVRLAGRPVAAQRPQDGLRGERVPGPVDLGDDGDEALGRVVDDLRVLLGRVEPGPARPRRPPLLRPTAHLGQPRQAVDREPPALVVGQVQVQHVEAVVREVVDEPLDVLDRGEAPRDVEHRAAVRVARRVRDLDRRHLPRDAVGRGGRLDLGGQELEQRARAAVQACGRRAGEHDAALPRIEGVGLGRGVVEQAVRVPGLAARLEPEHHGPRLPGRLVSGAPGVPEDRLDRKVERRGRPQLRGEQLAHADRALLPDGAARRRVDDDPGRVVEHEGRGVRDLDRRRERDEPELLRVRRPAGGGRAAGEGHDPAHPDRGEHGERRSRRAPASIHEDPCRTRRADGRRPHRCRP